ncbi:hypothetical protein [Geminicoccus roseus]|uniref:hypothetical protein n=1 Tax=Geminicoccus roseus TaxID=404900 RepID=UPI00040C27B0|nr:hypothetical protein [Geminicoccus roseus]
MDALPREREPDHGVSCRWQARIAWLVFMLALVLPFAMAAARHADWTWPAAQALLRQTLPDGWSLIQAWGSFYRAPLLLSALAASLAQARLWRRMPRAWPRQAALRAGLFAISLGCIVLAVQQVTLLVDRVVEQPFIELPAEDRDIEQTLLGQLARVAAGTDFNTVIGEALERGDVNHARIHVEAAGLLGIPLRPETMLSFAEATSWRATILRQSVEVMRGGATGQSDSLGSLAGALAVDLTPAGDLRDIAYQLGVPDEPDRFVLGLSVFGLSLTALAFVVPQQAIPARFGKAFLKTAGRFAKVSPGVGADIRRIGTTLVDLPAAGRAARSMDLTPARAARLVRHEVATELGHVGGRLYRIHASAGTAGTLAVLKQADDLADLSFYQRIAKAMGPTTEAVLTLVGKNSKTAFRVYRAGKRVQATIGGWMMALLTGLGGLVASLSSSLTSSLARRRLRRVARTGGYLPRIGLRTSRWIVEG